MGYVICYSASIWFLQYILCGYFSKVTNIFMYHSALKCTLTSCVLTVQNMKQKGKIHAHIHQMVDPMILSHSICYFYDRHLPVCIILWLTIQLYYHKV
jgi:hypothetical protein